jgi:hypothetical protein
MKFTTLTQLCWLLAALSAGTAAAERPPPGVYVLERDVDAQVILPTDMRSCGADAEKALRNPKMSIIATGDRIVVNKQDWIRETNDAPDMHVARHPESTATVLVKVRFARRGKRAYGKYYFMRVDDKNVATCMDVVPVVGTYAPLP